MIDPTAAPFKLDEDDLEWVSATLAGMSVEAKVGQLFCLLVNQPDPDSALAAADAAGVEPGGYMALPLPARSMQDLYRTLQASATVPLLLAADLERGGDGIVSEGTSLGSPFGVAATDDEEYAYKLGLVAGREGAAVGCNWAFAPIIDIDFNYANPITNTRTFGSDPARVLRMARSYMAGIHEAGLAVTIKHWPGDGVDGRDQHLVTSVNTLSVEDWDATFGNVFKGMIDAGADTVMSAHIMQPAYTRALRPGIADAEIMPASLAPELTIDLLRGRLRFNGLVTTDATMMAGMTVAMPRRKALPTAIMAGSDVLLFAGNLTQDFGFMLRGVESGLLTTDRLDDAVKTILSFKASLGLHRKQANRTLVPDQSALSIIGCEEHQAWARQCAEHAITLVKDKQHLLPISAARYGKILLYVLGDKAGFHDAGSGIAARFIERLTEAGFVVDNFDYTKADGPATWSRFVDPLAYVIDYDLVVYLANLRSATDQTTRIEWGQPMGFDVPRLVEDIPTVFVSVDNPYHLQDVPTMKTFINGYTPNRHVIDAIVDRMLGTAPFTGISPSDPYCGLWDAAR